MATTNQEEFIAEKTELEIVYKEPKSLPNKIEKDISINEESHLKASELLINLNKKNSKVDATSELFMNTTKKRQSIGVPIRRTAFSIKEIQLDNIQQGGMKKKINRSITIRSTAKRNFDSEMIDDKPKFHKFKKFVKKYLDHNIELAIMTFVTLFALTGSDLKVIGLSPNYDSIFNGFFILVMLLFFIELLASIWVKQGYFKSFFFWLDLFASFSMILEIDWILFPAVNLLIYLSLDDNNNNYRTYLIESKQNHKLNMTVRILRIIRLIRIVKLYKAAVVFFNNLEKKKKILKYRKKKLEKEKMIKKKEEERKRKEEEKTRLNVNQRYKRKNFMSKKSIKKNSQNFINILKEPEREVVRGKVNVQRESAIMNNTISETKSYMLENHSIAVNDKCNALIRLHKMKLEQEEIIELNVESNISRAASESITQKIIFIILLMLFIAPITDDDVYTSDDNISYLILCKFINNYWVVYGDLNNERNLTINKFIEESADANYPIIQILYNNTQIWYNYTIIDNIYRVDEIGYAFSPDGYSQIIFSNKIIAFISAWINLCRTVFVILILYYMAVGLNRDVKIYVLKPLEAMIDLVDSVAKDPINMKKIESLKNKLNKNTITKLQKFPMKKDSNKLANHNSGINQVPSISNNIANFEIEGAEYEMRVIQMAIIKISALLAIGFGEAGGEILRENMSSQEGLNPMIPGKKKCAIFGFCDIRHFPDINVALQEKTMVFVNEIADIVHSCVDKFGGSANKNIGDAFLTVWKFPHLENLDFDELLDPIEQLRNSDPKLNNKVADQAVLGYLNIIKKINKSPTIINYKNNTEIKSRFGDKFKVQMGFGLHYGWAIEGSIGSFYKIDCSYLSPNVNIAARLEAATRQYGVSILISGELYDLLSLELQNICRIIDIVTVKGSKTPIRLYTIYVNHNLKQGKLKRKELTMKEKRKYYMNKKEKLKEDFQNSKSGSIGKLVLNKKGFKDLIVDKKRQVLFYDKFHEGFLFYLDGNWDKAYNKFKDALFLDPSDGPSKTLFNYIKTRNRKCPPNWNRCRELTSK